jgi:hypothetical protein
MVNSKQLVTAHEQKQSSVNGVVNRGKEYKWISSH